MKRIAVLFADGVEESEALTIVDILRRAEMDAKIVGVPGREILGAHQISIQADVMIKELQPEDWDMIVVPGGYDGVDHLLDSKEALRLIQNMSAKGKYTAAICAGPRVLDKAGVLDGKTFTCYPGQEKLISSGIFKASPVITDGQCITAAGPALCYAFSYTLIDALGGNSLAVKNRMVYFNAFDPDRSVKETVPETIKKPEHPAKVAVLMKEGYEEGETFSIVDLLRRLGLICHTFRFEEAPYVKGMHQMQIRADKRFPEDIEDYDAVVLPGGRPGGQNLREDPDVIDLLKRWNQTDGKILSALCAGTTVLAEAKVIEDKHMTGYTGYAEKLPGAVFEEKLTVADQNLVTSQGPATGYPFAFRLAEVLGYDTQEVRSRLMYGYAGGKNE